MQWEAGIYGDAMPAKRSRTEGQGRFGRITDVRFMEVEFERPVQRRMVIEVEGGLRLLVADDESVELAAQLLNALARRNRCAQGAQSAEKKGGRK